MKMKITTGKISIAMAIGAVILFLMSAAAPISQGGNVNSFSATGDSQAIPAISMNSNVTWSTYYNGWTPLEYSNGTSNQSLATSLSTFYASPITVNPSDIQGQTFSGKIGGYSWQNKSRWYQGQLGASYTTETITNTSSTITITTSENSLGASYANAYFDFPLSASPSSNLAYDYLSLIGYITLPKTLSNGIMIMPSILNKSTIQNPSQTTTLYISNGSIIYNPNSPSYLTNNSEPFFLSFNYHNFTKTNNIYYLGEEITINAPEGINGTDLSITITGMNLGETPLSIGTSFQTDSMQASYGIAHLATFSPTFAWSKISNNGYSVAISQTPQNLTTQQSAISGGNYIEQVTYEGNFMLPTAPDLSYSSSNISEQFSMPTAQTQVIDINGVSYLSSISGKNGSITFTTVNPNEKSTFIQIIDYTSSQWTAISGPPGFFSVAGIEYYFDEIVIAIMGMVGIGGGAAAVKAKQARRLK